MFIKSYKLTIGQLLIGVLGLVPCLVWAAPKVLVFDQSTWATWQQQKKRPHVLVFSRSDCAHCPAVLKQIALELKQRHLKAGLGVVLMDGIEVAQAIADEPYYKVVNQFYAASVDETKLRYAINPTWPGITPYVAIMDKRGQLHFVMGPPSKALFDQTLN